MMFERMRTSPASSASFMMPSHMVMIPIKPRAILTAVAAESRAPLVTASMFPVNAPVKKAMATSPNQT